MVTPDGERTMNTYLGAAQDLRPDDIDEAQVAGAAVIYLEGYLWDPPQAKEAFVKAAAIAHKAGRRVALTLSDAFCVDRYRAEFLDLIRNGTVDIVFANEHELRSLYETADFDSGARRRCSRTPSSRSSPAARRAAWWSAATAWKRCTAVPVETGGRRDRRRRSVRRRLPGRPGARRRSSHRGSARRRSPRPK